MCSKGDKNTLVWFGGIVTSEGDGVYNSSSLYCSIDISGLGGLTGLAN